jgi:hypothetical protein
MKPVCRPARDELAVGHDALEHGMVLRTPVMRYSPSARRIRAMAASRQGPTR